MSHFYPILTKLSDERGVGSPTSGFANAGDLSFSKIHVHVTVVMYLFLMEK
jgi:hypothetical protein